MSFALIGAGELFMGSGNAAPDRRRAEAPMALGEVPVYGRLRRLGRDRHEPSTSLAAARQKVDAADSEVVDALATQLAETAVDGRGMRILIAAATPVAEAGQVALALARAITDAGRRVVVIEVADQVPGFGSGVGPGLAQLIDASASFADVIHRDPRSRVHFIPRGSSSLVLDAEGAERLAIAIDALGLTYDFVILIGPPGEAQLTTLAALSDSAILVAAGGAGDAATVAAHERLVATGLDDVVVLLSHRPDPPDGKERLAA
jgi:polysaccharide biosynthesis transport protein